MFTALPQAETITLVNYMGQYRNRRFDWPLLGWLIHRFRVLPTYDPLIAKHLAEVKRRAEASGRARVDAGRPVAQGAEVHAVGG